MIVPWKVVISYLISQDVFLFYIGEVMAIYTQEIAGPNFRPYWFPLIRPAISWGGRVPKKVPMMKALQVVH